MTDSAINTIATQAHPVIPRFRITESLNPRRIPLDRLDIVIDTFRQLVDYHSNNGRVETSVLNKLSGTILTKIIEPLHTSVDKQKFRYIQETVSPRFNHASNRAISGVTRNWSCIGLADAYIQTSQFLFHQAFAYSASLEPGKDKIELQQFLCASVNHAETLNCLTISSEDAKFQQYWQTDEFKRLTYSFRFQALDKNGNSVKLQSRWAKLNRGFGTEKLDKAIPIIEEFDPAEQCLILGNDIINREVSAVGANPSQALANLKALDQAVTPKFYVVNSAIAPLCAFATDLRRKQIAKKTTDEIDPRLLDFVFRFK